MPSNDCTSASRTQDHPRKDDQDVEVGKQQAARPTQEQGQNSTTLTTDDDAQRDDLTVEPGNS